MLQLTSLQRQGRMVRKQPIQQVLDGTDLNLGGSTTRTDQIPDNQF